MAALRRSRSAHGSMECAMSRTMEIDEDSSSNVRVVCRMRPLNDREKKFGTSPVAHASTERKEVSVTRSVGGGARQTKTSFQFDEVLGSFSTQYETFTSTVKPLIRQVLAGYDATVVAYGQTGTGKTFTMEGETDSEHARGLVPRAAGAILQALSSSEYTNPVVTVSYLEIHNEELRDLLAPVNSQHKLDLMESGAGMCCTGLSEMAVASVADVLVFLRTAQERKQIAETRLNSRSSRSHCIFTMKVACRRQADGKAQEIMGKLHLVDLAGSECAKKAAWAMESTGMTESERDRRAIESERERRAINQSLLTLGRVIAALRAKSTRIPYRDSKLTRVLKDSLGGSCQTVLIVTVTPAASAVEETISTLTYAEQATGIVNRPTIRSMLNTHRGSSDLCGEGSNTSNSGCPEVAELQMKVSYLSQEVEEAQGLLERKRVEAEQLSVRAEAAEAEAADLRQELERARSSLESSRSDHAKVASSAQMLSAEVTAATATLLRSKESIAAEVAALKQQRADEERLNALLAQQKEELHAGVQEVHSVLASAKAELAKTQAQLAGMKESHRQARARALDAIMKSASAELELLGQDFDQGADSLGKQFDKVEGIAQAAGQGVDAAQERSGTLGAQVAEAASAWSEHTTTQLAAVQDMSSDLIEIMQTHSSSVAQQLADIRAVGVRWEQPAERTLKENDENVMPVPASNKDGGEKVLSTAASKLSAKSPKECPNRMALRELSSLRELS